HPSLSLAALIEIHGADGAAGTPGSDGPPAADGGAGGDGEDVAQSIVGPPLFDDTVLYGGEGGAGGCGPPLPPGPAPGRGRPRRRGRKRDDDLDRSGRPDDVGPRRVARRDRWKRRHTIGRLRASCSGSSG